MKINNLVQLIRETKPQAALFTTYTLSLSFFEAVVLPVLRQVGCHDVAILVDANEAVISLAEAHVNYAGRRYWVAPVLAPGGGVFHPKVTYLSCREHDVLAVGSGNLTLPGQSGQLETLDAVRSSSSPSVFIQFEALSKTLADKIEHTSKQAADLLREYGARALSVASSVRDEPLSNAQAPVLVHSVSRPANEQIIELWRAKETEAALLTVLSPFHAPDAGPVDRLALALDAEIVAIGLDPRTRVAPFDQSRFKAARNACFVVPALEGSPRRLHGKVFEVVGKGGTLVVTGSINATQQSLESIKNIEVSLARWLPFSCFKWTVVEPARFEPNNYDFQAHEADFAFVTAILESNGIVHGRLFGSKTIPQSATVNILRFDVPLDGQARSVEIGVSGEFTFGPVPELASDGAVQLTFSGPNLQATCWLNVSEELVSSDDECRNRQSVRRVLRGDFQPDDVAVLLQILCRAASFRPVQPPQATPGKPESPSIPISDIGDTPFSFRKWQSSGRINRGRGLLGVRYDDTLKAFIRWLNHGGKKVPPSVIGEQQILSKSNQSFIDLSEKPDSRENVDIEEMLRQLIDSIPRLFSEHPDIEYADILASVAGAHALKQTLTSTWVDERRFAPILAWLDSYSRYTYRKEVLLALQPIALGLAMVTAACAKSRQLVIPGSLLKESLQRFGLDAKAIASRTGMLKQALDDEVFCGVDDNLRLLAEQVSDDVWGGASVDDRLVRLVEASRETKPQPDMENETLFPGVLAVLRRHRGVRGLQLLTHSSQLRGCPHCYKPFENSAQNALRAKHAIVCSGEFCKKVVFFVEDSTIAKRIKDVLTND